MENTLNIISSVSTLLCFLLLLTFFKKSSLPMFIIREVLNIAIFATQLSILVFKIHLGQSYGVTICMLCLWIINMVVVGIAIGIEVAS